MGIRAIQGDEHYGYIGFGSLTASAADTYSAAILPTISEPAIIIKEGRSKSLLEIIVDEVMIWDCREWHVKSNQIPDLTGGESLLQFVQGGLTKDNTALGNDAPSADTLAEGTRSGGAGAAVAGLAAGGPGNRMVGDEQPTRYVTRWEFWQFSNEENAAGEINIPFQQNVRIDNTMYQVDGHNVHYLMTAAHYHMWLLSSGTGVAGVENLGAEVRRMSVDDTELLFDRGTLLTILAALDFTR